MAETYWIKVRQFENEISNGGVYNLMTFISFLRSKRIKLTTSTLTGIIYSLKPEDQREAFSLLHDFVKDRHFTKKDGSIFKMEEEP